MSTTVSTKLTCSNCGDQVYSTTNGLCAHCALERLAKQAAEETVKQETRAHARKSKQLVPALP